MLTEQVSEKLDGQDRCREDAFKASRFDKGSVVFAFAVTATARSEVNTSTFNLSDLAIFRTESRF